MISASRLLASIQQGNRFTRERYTPFFCASVRVGWIRAPLVAELRRYPRVFTVEPDGVHVNRGLTTCDSRSEAIADVVRELGTMPGFGRWNDEFGSIAPCWGGERLMCLPRCATRPFGVRSYGSHVNGMVRRQDEIEYWVARRDSAVSDYGGYFDTLAGGYIAADRLPSEVACAEVREEAGIDLARHMRPVSLVRGVDEDDDGVTPYMIFCFDVELPAGEQPNNRDGEIESFHLLSVEQVLERLEPSRFKFNAVPVIVDWMVRQGLVDSDDPAFAELADALTRWGPEREVARVVRRRGASG